MSTRIHHAGQHTLILCGIDVSSLKGWADGVVITIAPVGDGYTDHQGTDGDTTRADTGENRYTLTFNAMQGAECNAILQELYNTGKRLKNGGDVAPTTIRNPLGTYNFFSAESWIVSPAEWSLDRAPATRPWVIRAVDPIIVGA